jgi:hypothetical protein
MDVKHPLKKRLFYLWFPENLERGGKNEKVFEQKVSGSFPGSADFRLVGRPVPSG